jgi:hypothetical protein
MLKSARTVTMAVIVPIAVGVVPNALPSPPPLRGEPIAVLNSTEHDDAMSTRPHPTDSEGEDPLEHYN